MDKSQSYGGSLINFDLPAVTGATAYLEDFIRYLGQKGCTEVRRRPGAANLVEAHGPHGPCLFYFQGSGIPVSAWWAFQGGVILKEKDAADQENPRRDFYLALGWQTGAETRYWFRRINFVQDTPEQLLLDVRYAIPRKDAEHIDRLMLAGDDPTGFKPPFEVGEEVQL